MSRNPWYGCDLDGTLAHYDHYTTQGDEIGTPIEPIVHIVETLLGAGHEVKIYTARVAYDEDQRHRKMIQEFTRKIFGRPLEVTNAKDYGMITCLDDRATQVIPNTGILVQDLVPEALRELHKISQ